MVQPPEETPQIQRWKERARQSQLALWILDETTADIERRLSPDASPYEILGISHLVRRLLLDGNNVIDAARRDTELPPPVFHCTPFHAPNAPSEGSLYWVEDGEPELQLAFALNTFSEHSVALSLKELLQTPVALYRSMPLSVRDYVRAYAHVIGGVHLGRPDSDAERMLQTYVAFTTPGLGGGAAAATLQGIGRVVYTALHDLTTRSWSALSGS